MQKRQSIKEIRCFFTLDDAVSADELLGLFSVGSSRNELQQRKDIERANENASGPLFTPNRGASQWNWDGRP